MPLLSGLEAKNVRTASAISSLALNLMIFLSGATMPIEWMPNVLRMIAHLTLLYYVNDLTRQTWNFTPIWENGVDVAVLIGVAIVSIICPHGFSAGAGNKMIMLEKSLTISFIFSNIIPHLKITLAVPTIAAGFAALDVDQRGGAAGRA
ncbi:ABC transporter permease [Paenibacillus sp. FSL R5-0527]